MEVRRLPQDQCPAVPAADMRAPVGITAPKPSLHFPQVKRPGQGHCNLILHYLFIFQPPGMKLQEGRNHAFLNSMPHHSTQGLVHRRTVLIISTPQCSLSTSFEHGSGLMLEGHYSISSSRRASKVHTARETEHTDHLESHTS